MNNIEKQNLLKWLNYTEKDVVVKSFFGLKRKIVNKIYNANGSEVSFDFENDWNDLMNLVKSIEIKGYDIFISNVEIRISRDFRINPYFSPEINISVQLKKNDDKKSILYYVCTKFINKYLNKEYVNAV